MIRLFLQIAKKVRELTKGEITGIGQIPLNDQVRMLIMFS